MSTNFYDLLNDAANNADVPEEVRHMLKWGQTQIWYAKNSCLAPDEINPSNLHKTHGLIGCIATDNLDHIFTAMQGENWSPYGEARGLIERIPDVHHTSMSVDDIIVLPNGTMWICEMIGWREL